MAVLHIVGDAASGDKRGRRGGVKGGKSNSNCIKFIKMTTEKNLARILLFSFSTKYCKFNAPQVANFDYKSTEERKIVGKVFQNVMEVLSKAELIISLIKRGVGNFRKCTGNENRQVTQLIFILFFKPYKIIVFSDIIGRADSHVWCGWSPWFERKKYSHAHD